MNKKVLLFVLIPFVLLTMTACSISGIRISPPQVEVVEGSGNIVTEERAVSGFNQVTLSGLGDLTIVQGDTESLTIEADDNIINRITTEVIGSRLVIGMEPGFNFNLPKGIQYRLTVKDLTKIEITGFGNVEMDSLKTDKLTLQLTGSGNINLGDLTADSLDLTISGFGSADVAGSVQDQEVTITGSGNFDAEDLQSETANVTIGGFGSANIWVKSALDVRITGSGSVDYYGSPSVTQDVTGFGSVNNKGEK